MDTAELEFIDGLSNRKTGSHLDKFRVLRLNADYRPMSYCPLSTWNWQQVMFLLVKGRTTGIPRIHVVEEYEDVYVHGVRDKIKLPSVVAHRDYVSPPTKVPYTKFNIFLRDDFTCQYTGEKCDPKDLTFDHVIPRAQGGRSSWDNIVAARQDINELKDNRTATEFAKKHGYHLRRKPYEPSFYELQEKGRKYPPKYLHESWEDYLYWNSELEQS